MKTIILTGGGTAGHVMPNIALLDDLVKHNWNIHYIGSYEGIEHQLISDLKIPYHGISSGKLRRYFSLKNFIDPFKVFWGLIQAIFIVRRLKPQVIFSKGGFVTLPVVIAGFLNRVPVVIHESDFSPGLANRLSFPFANKIALSFDTTVLNTKWQSKTVPTGLPVRKVLISGNRERGLNFCGFENNKPCVLVIGGSLGSINLNTQLRESLQKLLNKFNVIHICGKGKTDATYTYPGYYQLEFAHEILPDLYAASDVIVSRAGANSVYEIMMLQKPNILIPLSARASRGDQIENAAYFKNKGVTTILDDDSLTVTQFIDAINDVYARREEIIAKIKALRLAETNTRTIRLIESFDK